MKVSFIQNAENVSVVRYHEGTISDTLKPAVYTVAYSDITGYYLKYEFDQFTLPERIFGNVNKRIGRIINTYNHRDKHLGVLCTGLKGSGKTLLVRALSNALVQSNIPVIQVQDCYHGSAFTSFMDSIGECAVIFDEFAKVYGEEQSSMLGFFDGSGNSKRLHVITENYEHTLNEYLLARPSRMHYHFRYGRIDDSVIRDYCAHHKLPDMVTDELIRELSKARDISFDIISTIINEYTLYGDSISEIISILNTPRTIGQGVFEIVSVTSRVPEKVIKNHYLDHHGTIATVTFYRDEDYESKPSREASHLSVKSIPDNFDSISVGYVTFHLESDSGLVSIDNGVYTFEDEDIVLKVTKVSDLM